MGIQFVDSNLKNIIKKKIVKILTSLYQKEDVKFSLKI